MELDVSAAERFLTSLPLFSLHDAGLSEPPRRSKSLSSHAETALQAHDVEGFARVQRTDEKQPPWTSALGRAARAMALDVIGAQRFLNSLMVSNEAEPSSISTSEHHHVSAESASPSKEPKMRQTRTVVGGWRSHSDLLRLVPSLIKKGLLGGRVDVMTRETCAYICSVRPPSAETQASVGGSELPQVKLPISAGFGGWWLSLTRRRSSSTLVNGTSYASYLVASQGGTYDPDFLDDHSLKQGKNHTVLRLEGYQVSFIPFVRPRRLKDELNDQFRCSHPRIHPSLTLSKLRNLQKDLREITLTMPMLDVSSVAIAWVYFEKLVLKGVVNKASRKLLAGACLVLAFKFHQRGDPSQVKQLAAEIRKMDRKDRLQWEDLHEAELNVFVWLEFGLHVQLSEVMPHLHRLLKDLGLSLADAGEAGILPARSADDDPAEPMVRDSAVSFQLNPLH